MYVIYFLEIVTVICVITGIYRLLLFITGRASGKAYKTAAKIVGIKDKESAIARLADDLAIKLSKYIKLDDMRQTRLRDMLRYNAGGMSREPKVFVAENIIKSVLIFIPGILLMPFLPMLTFGFAVLAAFSYYATESLLYKNYLNKKREIEYELPRFCSVIGQEVKATKDVIGILGRYMPTANRALREELKVLIADMNSSNYESALKRFEVRLGIDKMAEIVRGLIGTVRGDDTVTYFEMLSRDLDQLELQRLNDIASMQPRKVGKYQLIVLAVMIANYVVIMILYVMGLGRPF